MSAYIEVIAVWTMPGYRGAWMLIGLGKSTEDRSIPGKCYSNASGNRSLQRLKHLSMS